MEDSITAKELLKTEGILTSSPSSTLAQALAKLKSSHDAVFVVDKKEKLLGVVSPYYVLFHSNFPPTTKVENCFFSPPKLKENTPIWEIARNMMESKVYYLPVIGQNGSWLGIVSVRTLLRRIAQDKDYVRGIQIPRKAKIITISENANLGKARALLSNKGVSRLPVVSPSGKLVGIITRYDLREALSQPRGSQRFLSRAGEKRKFINKPIKGYFKKSPVTATDNTPLSQIISSMLDRQIGSIIIVNSKWQPVDIISYGDLLKAIVAKGQKLQRNLILNLPEDFSQKEKLEAILEALLNKMQTRNRIHRLEANLEMIKNPAGEKKLYRVKLIAYHLKLENIVAQGSDHKWNTALRKAIEKIQKQSRRIH